MENQIDIYSYKDPALFLRDHWLLKKKKNPSFSIRAWSKSLGITSHSQLHQMIYGKRAIPKKYLSNLVKNLQLNNGQVEYLEALIDIQKAKSEEEKSFYLNKILSKRKQLKVVFHEIEQFDLVKNPLHFFILEMFQLKNQNLTVDQIKEHLQFEYSTAEIKRAIDTLLKLGIASKISENEYTKIPNNIFNQSEVPNAAIREYHKNLADLTKVAIEKQDLNEREFNAVTFNIKKETLSEAKKAIREFREQFVDKFCAMESEGDQTYHLNVNFFAITKERQ
ncbi:MAG: TIGR02147 family protein [Bacteriovoracaceae bacterium]